MSPFHNFLQYTPSFSELPTSSSTLRSSSYSFSSPLSSSYSQYVFALVLNICLFFYSSVDTHRHSVLSSLPLKFTSQCTYVVVLIFYLPLSPFPGTSQRLVNLFLHSHPQPHRPSLILFLSPFLALISPPFRPLLQSAHFILHFHPCPQSVSLSTLRYSLLLYSSLISLFPSSFSAAHGQAFITTLLFIFISVIP